MFIRALMLSFGLICVVTVAALGEFQVNEYTDYKQEAPKVAMRADGSFVVVWESWMQDGSFNGVFGRRFDWTATPTGGDFGVNADTEWAQLTPDIGIDGAGREVITFVAGDGCSEGVWVRAFASNGWPYSDEVWVNSFTGGREMCPAIDMNGSGEMVIVWESSGPGTGTSTAWHIKGRCYNGDGTSRSNELAISQLAMSHQGAVSMDDTGEFVVAWARSGASNALPLGHSVRMRRYYANGVAKGSETVLATPAYQVRDVAIDGDGAGNHIVAALYEGVSAVWVNANGQIAKPWTAVSAEDAVINSTSMAVAMNRAGEAMVVWSESPDGVYNGRRIWARTFGADREPLAPAFRLSKYAHGDSYEPDVALGDDGGFVVVWTNEGQDGDQLGAFATTGNIHDPRTYPTAGDANLDGVVDLDDFVILRTHFGNVDAGWASADFDFDGDVDLEDFAALKANFGDRVEPGWPSEITGTVFLDIEPTDGVRQQGQRDGFNPAIVYAVDWTVHAYAPLRGSFDFEVDVAETMQEAGYHAAKLLNRRIVARGMGDVVNVAALIMDGWDFVHSVGYYPTPNYESVPANWDFDGDGRPDVERELGYEVRNSPVRYARAMDNAVNGFEDIFDEMGGGDTGLLVFFSAGRGLEGDPVDASLAELNAMGVDVVGVGMGASSVVDDPATTTLDLIAVDPQASAAASMADVFARVDPYLDAWSADCSGMEPALAGWTVFADVNGDGELDADEPRDVTGDDGVYRIEVPRGRCAVVALPPESTGVWRFSSPVDGSVHVNAPAAGIASGIDFGVYVGLNAVSGDADLDGDVDLDDFVILKSNFGSGEADWSSGDFDGDGDVDLDDFVILKSSFGTFANP